MDRAPSHNMPIPSVYRSPGIEEGGPQKRIATSSKRTLVIRTPSLKTSPALSRWLSESPAESPWNTLLLQPGQAKSKIPWHVTQRLDELLTGLEGGRLHDGPWTTRTSQRYSLGPKLCRYEFRRAPVLFSGRRTKTTVQTIVVSDTDTASEKSQPLTCEKSLSPAGLDLPAAAPNEASVECDLYLKKRGRDDSDPPLASSKRLRTEAHASVSGSKTTPLSDPGRPIPALFTPNDTNVSEAFLCHSDTKGEESAAIPTVCDPSPARRDGWPAATSELPLSSRSAGFPGVVDIASNCEDSGSPSWQDTWSPACSGRFGRSASTPPSTPGSLSEPLADRQDLLSHATAFNSVLAAYGSQVNTKDKQQEDKPSDTSAKPDATQRCSEKSRKRPFDDEPPGKGGSSDSEDESRRPNKAQKKSISKTRKREQPWACPFHQFNSANYANCGTWSAKPIGDVTRHVLAIGHSSSPDMNEEKAHGIRSLGKFATGEKRWKAIYSRLFDIPQDSPLIPSPYLGIMHATGASADAPPVSTTLPLAGTTSISDEVSISQPINPHASTFAAEATRLFEVFEFRSNALRVRRHQLRNQIEEINAQVQATDAEDKRLQLALQADLDRLNTLFSQPGGFPPAAEQLHIPPDVPVMLPSTDNTSLGPDPFHATIQGMPDTGTSEFFDATVPESQAAGPSMAGDSGYGTVSTSNESYCTCYDVWCFKCDKAGDNFFEGC